MVFEIPFHEGLDASLDWKQRLIPKMFIFSGKGGVGKTSVSAAISCRRASEGKRVLIASVDPAHSLGDSLGVSLDDHEIHAIDGFGGKLHALEIDFNNMPGVQGDGGGNDVHQEAIGDLVNEALFPAPEEMRVVHGLVEMANHVFTNRLSIQEVFIDAAPSGHFLRAITFPFRMQGFMEKFALLYSKMKFMFEFNRRKRQLLEEKERSMQSFSRIMGVLTNPAITTMTLVTIPESMALAETSRTLAALRELGIPVHNLIINKIHAGSRSSHACSFCQRRAANEHAVIEEIERGFPGLSITKVPLLAREVRCIDALSTLGKYL